jgi:hypothetical protein
VREGVLYVSSGGINRLFRPEGQPSPLGIFLGVILEAEQDEAALVHEVRVTVTREGGEEEIGRLTAALQGHQNPTAAVGILPGEPIIVPIAIPLTGVMISGLGMYDIRVSVDGGVPEIRTVYAVAPPQ